MSEGKNQTHTNCFPLEKQHLSQYNLNIGVFSSLQCSRHDIIFKVSIMYYSCIPAETNFKNVSN